METMVDCTRKAKQLEEELVTVNKELKASKEEHANLQALLRAREHYAQETRRELRLRDRVIVQLKQEVAEQSEELSKIKGDLVSKDEELEALRRKASELSNVDASELLQLREENAMLKEKLKPLEDRDLYLKTRVSEAVQQELDQTKAEKDLWQKRAQDLQESEKQHLQRVEQLLKERLSLIQEIEAVQRSAGGVERDLQAATRRCDKMLAESRRVDHWQLERET
ncbi:hypothetical protein L2V44_14165, partial [Staphylococcus aureus]|nr:hypothetical protein [Staphylococcus aureus]